MARKTLLLLGPLVCAMAVAGTAQAQERDLDCRLDYSLSGWSLIYKQTSGGGIVTCDGGESMRVRVRARALGLTVGRWQIDHGTGRFTDVRRIAQAARGTRCAHRGYVGIIER